MPRLAGQEAGLARPLLRTVSVLIDLPTKRRGERSAATAANAKLPEALRAATSQVNPAWYTPTHSVLAGLAVLGIMAAAFAALRIRSIDFYY
jgi:hypothetical protein